MKSGAEPLDNIIYLEINMQIHTRLMDAKSRRNGRNSYWRVRSGSDSRSMF